MKSQALTSCDHRVYNLMQNPLRMHLFKGKVSLKGTPYSSFKTSKLYLQKITGRLALPIDTRRSKFQNIAVTLRVLMM
jgi:hypothetical protein